MSQLYPALQAYFDKLGETTMPIDPSRQSAIGELVEWIQGKLNDGSPSPIIVVCTGNSRRSIMGSVLGNAAALYRGLPNVQFFSGGTEPTAINPRTIRVLQEVGVRFTPTGRNGAAGAAGEPNPIYGVQWSDDVEFCTDFSKHFADPINPHDGFAAVMVCDEANQACPSVPGAELRVPMPFQDPKEFDDTPQEESAYRERRDDIATVMLRVLREVRNLSDEKPLPLGS
jgi:arsenate reductase